MTPNEAPKTKVLIVPQWTHLDIWEKLSMLVVMTTENISRKTLSNMELFMSFFCESIKNFPHIFS